MGEAKRRQQVISPTGTVLGHVVDVAPSGEVGSLPFTRAEVVPGTIETISTEGEYFLEARQDVRPILSLPLLPLPVEAPADDAPGLIPRLIQGQIDQTVGGIYESSAFRQAVAAEVARLACRAAEVAHAEGRSSGQLDYLGHIAEEESR